MKASERDDLLIKIDKNVSLLSQVVTGNGGRGHEQRLGDIEEWKNHHPRDCPHLLNGRQIVARRSLEVAIIGMIISLMMFLAKALRWW